MEDKVLIFDTTLRDGEQAPGASLSGTEKLEIARQLAVLGVDIIEAGFPVSSPRQFEGCQTIARRVKGPAITSLARTVEKDLEAAYDSIKEAERGRIHTFIASSPIHMKHKLNKDPDAAVFKASRFGIVEDYKKVMPPLLEACKKLKG